MANTTNFNWETPDDTDLVKDGAAAMRTLGNSIDASFVDLKGGTTGQYLKKNTSTDLDFIWGDVSGGGMTLISTTSLSGSSVTLSSIPQTYNSLRMVIRDVYPTGASTARDLNLELNGTQSIYFTQRTSAAAENNSVNTSRMQIAYTVFPAANDNTVIVDFPNYAATNVWKVATSQHFNQSTSAPAYTQGVLTTAIRTTSAISSITIVFTAEDLAGGSVELWGIK